MITTINALLTQKPTSPVPKCGEKHRYTLTERISKNGNPWTKAKAEGEGYGKEYEVVSVEKTDFVDAHGNLSYNIDLIELIGGEQREPVAAHDARAATPPSQPTVRSTSTNGSSAPDLASLGVRFFAALSKADDIVKEFYSEDQRAAMSAYEVADLTLRVAAGLNIEINRR